jgi:hypothetical protein
LLTACQATIRLPIRAFAKKASILTKVYLQFLAPLGGFVLVAGGLGQIHQALQKRDPCRLARQVK